LRKNLDIAKTKTKTKTKTKIKTIKYTYIDHCLFLNFPYG